MLAGQLNNGQRHFLKASATFWPAWRYGSGNEVQKLLLFFFIKLNMAVQLRNTGNDH